MLDTRHQNKLINLAMAFLGFSLAAMCAGLIPIYDLPFNGCSYFGYQHFDPHCSPWHDFSRGFLFVSIVGVVTFFRPTWPFIAFVSVFLAALFGGLDSIKYNSVFSVSIDETLSSGLLHGGGVALILLVAVNSFSGTRRAAT